MTRESSLKVLAKGTTGRTVLLCHPDPSDPGPETTRDRGITLLWLPPPKPGHWTELADETALALAQLASSADSSLLRHDHGSLSPVDHGNPSAQAVASIGVVSWSTGGLLAGTLAARHPDLVDRLVLVATEAPPADPPPPFDPARITAKTLLLYGAKDPTAGPRDGKWYQQRLPNRRYEQNPATGPLLLSSMWPRVLSHLAPNRRRPATAS